MRVGSRGVFEVLEIVLSIVLSMTNREAETGGSRFPSSVF